MPSTFRATPAFAANTLLLLTMASWGATAYTKLPKGCYSSSTPLKSQGTGTYQSSDYCQGVCEKLNQPVFGLSDGSLCWCGNELPATDTQVDNSKCNTPCQGYPAEMCGGGTSYWTIWLTGMDNSVPSYGGSGTGGGSGSSSSSSSTPPTPSSTSTTTPSSSPTSPTHTQKPRPHKETTVISGGGGGGKTTIVVTTAPSGAASSAPTPSSAPSSGGSTNVAGIAAGAVVGVVAAASIVAGVFFWLRHRRRQAAEEEYKRTQISDFMRGGERKPPSTGYSGMSDSRLDPEAGARRTSQGSIADDQDYSRRILRVANPGS